MNYTGIPYNRTTMFTNQEVRSLAQAVGTRCVSRLIHVPGSPPQEVRAQVIGSCEFRCPGCGAVGIQYGKCTYCSNPSRVDQAPQLGSSIAFGFKSYG